MTRKASKILTIVSVSVLALLIAAAVLTQTRLFKQTLRSTLYKLAEANLNGSIYLGEIRGNLFTGFSIDTVALYVNNASFVEARNITVRYDPLSLWNKRLALGNIEIDNPTISIIRGADGIWNVDRLAKKKSEPDSVPSPWSVTIKNLHITNARFRLIDSTSPAGRNRLDSTRSRAIDFSNIDLQRLDVQLSASLSAQEQTISLKNISFVSPREEFTLKKLSSEIRHTRTGTSMKDLFITTPHSHIELSATVQSVDVFAIKDIGTLQHVPVECTLSSTTVASDEIQKFLPSLKFLRGSVDLECAVKGEFGSLRVQKLIAAFGRSTIVLAGSLSNLHRPKDLTLNIESKGTVIFPSDVPKLLPFFHIPDYGTAGNLALDFHYVGKPLDFQVAATAGTPAGQVTVNGGLNLTGPVMKYKAGFGGTNVNLERFFGKPALRSHLDFSGTIDGEGTSIDELNTRLTVDLDSSLFHQIPISRLRIIAKAEHKDIDLIAEVRSPRGDISLHSFLDYASDDVPSYSLHGSFSRFDLSTILQDDRYASACSFTLNANGREFLREKMTGDLRMEFSPSQFGVHSFDTASVGLRIDIDSLGKKNLRLESPIADVSIDGAFTYAGVVGMIASHAEGIQLSYYRQRALFDSTFVATVDSVMRSHIVPEAVAEPEQENTIHYFLRLKNLEPLAIFIGSEPFAAVGDVEGTVRGNSDTLSAEGNLSIRSGKFTLKSGLFLVEKGSVAYKVEDMTRDSLFAVTNGPTVTLHVDAANVFVGETYFRKPSIDFNFRNRHAEYSVKGELDSTIILGVDGRAVVTPELYQFAFDNFSLRYQGYELNNVGRFSARMSRGGISIDSTTFVHQDERLTLFGSISYHGSMGAFVRLQNFALSDIHYFGRSPDFKASALGFGGTVNAFGSVGGTTDDPTLVSRIEVTNFSFRETEFGFVSGTMRYAGNVADCAIQLSRTEDTLGTYQLLCSGSIPMNLAFASADNRFSLTGMDLYLKAQSFDISIIDPFIAQLDEMKGTLVGSIHCTGSLESPQFSGGMELQQGQFLFPMNMMTYQTSGEIGLEGNRMSFMSFSVTNQYQDYSTGKIDVGGYIGFRGFVPDEYHLSAVGELKVLQNSSSAATQGVYGDLIAATGQEGLLFDGTYAYSRLSGALYVNQASLTFPPTKQAANQISSRYVNIVVVDDTSKIVEDTLRGPNIFAFFRPKKDTTQATSEQSFLDGLSYDLAIQTRGVVQIKMVFNAATGEELFADLNGKLNLSKEGNNVRLTGTITVSEKSHYKFYKQFDASGKLSFTGRPDNPQLDIKATYTGTRVKTDVTALKPQDPAQTTTLPTEKVVVTLAITGTRFDPKIKIGLSTFDDSGNEKERTGDVESDAISFLLTSGQGTPGKFRDDLTSNDKQGIANSLGGSIGGSLITGLTSSLLSGMTLDFLRSNNITAVSNVELRYSGASPDLRLSGVIGDAYWSFGGKVFNDLNNANVSLQWSLGSLIRSDKLRNFMFELDRKADAIETSEMRRPTSGARFYYRFAF